MLSTLLELLEENPIIAAIREKEDLDVAIDSPVNTVFILGGDILELENDIPRILQSGKYVFVHIDLVEGIGKDAAGVKYLSQRIKPSGLISTRHHLLKHGSDEGLITIQRMFLVDSSSFQSGIRLLQTSQPDLVEVMPGLVPKAITSLQRQVRQPVIAGGMITSKEDIIHALQAGALAVSTSNKNLWFI
ncbi:MAG: glycerol-3-phosphate responsive antiterminator [Clostridia bacterium]|jgi:glycerol uptake operon antiterminator